MTNFEIITIALLTIVTLITLMALNRQDSPALDRVERFLDQIIRHALEMFKSLPAVAPAMVPGGMPGGTEMAGIAMMRLGDLVSRCRGMERWHSISNSSKTKRGVFVLPESDPLAHLLLHETDDATHEKVGHKEGGKVDLDEVLAAAGLPILYVLAQQSNQQADLEWQTIQTIEKLELEGENQ